MKSCNNIIAEEQFHTNSIELQNYPNGLLASNAFEQERLLIYVNDMSYFKQLITSVMNGRNFILISFSLSID